MKKKTIAPTWICSSLQNEAATNQCASDLFRMYVFGDKGEKVRHKSCHDVGDVKVYNPIITSKWIKLFHEIALVFDLKDLAQYFLILASAYLEAGEN